MSASALNTPILFLIFRNPDCTRRVFEQIRAARPTRLFISADGPRPGHPTDQADCEATREVVANIDWDCEVKTRFLPENLGLKKAVSTAIDWFFDHVDEGIILEYDCLPDPSFFPFCEAMLERYRDNKRIFSITGCCIEADDPSGDGDYYYSRLTGVWGWASWKRSWKHWRSDLEDYDVFRKHRIIDSIATDKNGRDHLSHTFNTVQSGENSTTWAYCFLYAQIKQGSYCVIPRINMIENIGFGSDGTNALDPNHPLAKLKKRSMISYNAPKFFIPDVEADNRVLTISTYSPPNPLYKRIPRYALRRFKMIYSWCKASKSIGT